MCTFLIIYILTIQSSYLENSQQRASGAPDTIQFCLKGGDAWRIRTFSLDHDVHVWSMGKMTPVQLESVADANTKKHYGDVLGRKMKIQVNSDGTNLEQQLARAGLAAHVGSPDGERFAFWAHAPNLYRTKSSPQ
jgi:hypothetical protein